MSDTPRPPTEAEFLAAPVEQIAAVAPKSVVFAPGGTRRDAALAGVDVDSDEYPRWTFERMVTLFDRAFRHGVQHLFTGTITPNQWNEVGPYRKKLVGWIHRQLTNEDALARYARYGWRVRLVGWESIPEFEETAKVLEARTAKQSAHTLWWWAVPTYESVWEQILSTAHRTGARTREELIRAIYGEDVPLVSLFVGFAKPEVSPAHLPPLLAGQVQCYWTVRPGYSLDEAELRRILYDYAYTRRTWRADKSGRAGSALPYRAAWLHGPTLGLGLRLGQEFWYPAPTPHLPSEGGEGQGEGEGA